MNVAEVTGWGSELGISAAIRAKVSWDVGVRLATNGTHIDHLGELTAIGAGLRFEHRPHYPIGGIFV